MTQELADQGMKVNTLMKEVTTLQNRVDVTREHLSILYAELELKKRLFALEERVYQGMVNEAHVIPTPGKAQT